MIQFLIAISIVALACFIIYASERVIFHRPPAGAASHTWVAATCDGAAAVLLFMLTIVLMPILCIALVWRSMRPSSEAARKVVAAVKTMTRRAWLG
jgi:hypothetical protein